MDMGGRKGKMKRLKPLENTFKNMSKGCLNCGLAPIKLPMNYRIVQGFGGAHIMRNGKIYYWPDNWDGSPESWKKQKTLMSIENTARKSPRDDWRLENCQPLHFEEYQRQGKNNWVMVKKNMGFA
jgi:hypothetical protein